MLREGLQLPGHGFKSLLFFAVVASGTGVGNNMDTIAENQGHDFWRASSSVVPFSSLPCSLRSFWDNDGSSP